MPFTSASDLRREARRVDLIFISLEQWDQLWRRNQFVCDGLIRRNPDVRILFVAPSRDVTGAVRTRQFDTLRGRSISLVHGYDGRIIVTRTWKWFPNSIRLGRRANEALFLSHVRCLANRLQFYDPVLWINAHEAGHLAGKLDEAGLIYDVTDDWSSLQQTPATRDRTVEQDALLCERADAVIVCSHKLFELKSLLSQCVHLIPNGVDAAHYAEVCEGPEKIPALARTWERPVFGYTGTIHPERVDVELIMSIAQRLQQGSMVLLGPNLLSASDSERLLATGRVHLPGPVPYAELPNWMSAFDVCVVPHLVTPFTESLNPIKLWEYLAAGKPIVSTRVAGFRDYPQFVRLVEGAAEFASALNDALQGDTAGAVHRREEARRHSWESRVEKIERVIAEVVRKRGGLHG